jgi:alcohol dehydrogenase (cytochrome c)
MTLKKIVLMASLVLSPVWLAGQGPTPNTASAGKSAPVLDASELLKPLKDSWPSYSGDYSGKRYSLLTQVNQTTVKNLTLAWTMRLSAGDPTQTSAGGGRGFGGGRGGFGGAPAAPVIIGGEGTGEFPVAQNNSVKGAILKVGDVLYVTAPDNVWAVDARDGRELWRYFWKTKGGTHIGNRGAAI